MEVPWDWVLGGKGMQWGSNEGRERTGAGRDIVGGV